MKDSLSSAASAVYSTRKELSKLLHDSKLEFEAKLEEDPTSPRSRSSRSAENQNSSNLKSTSMSSSSSSVLCGGSSTEMIVSLHKRLEESYEKISSLEKALAESTQVRNAALDKVHTLEKQSEQLRSLYAETMRSNDQYKAKMHRAESFFNTLGSVQKVDMKQSEQEREKLDEMLKYSQPPEDFNNSTEAFRIEAYKVETGHGTELEITKARLKQAHLEIDKLKNQVDKLLKQKAKALDSKGKKLREAEQLVASKHMQVLGAVRRVHYLLEQNERQQSEIAKKDEYIAKIEAKLLELNRDLNEMRVQRASNAATSSAERIRQLSNRDKSAHSTPASLRVCWDSIFEQGALGRSPGLTASGMSRMTRSDTNKRPTPQNLSPRATSKSSEEILEGHYDRWKTSSSTASSHPVKTTNRREQHQEELLCTRPPSTAIKPSTSSPKSESDDEEEYEFDYEQVEDQVDEDEEDDEVDEEQIEEMEDGTRQLSRFERMMAEELASAPSPSGDADALHDEWLDKLGASPL